MAKILVLEQNPTVGEQIRTALAALGSDHVVLVVEDLQIALDGLLAGPVCGVDVLVSDSEDLVVRLRQTGAVVSTCCQW